MTLMRKLLNMLNMENWKSTQSADILTSELPQNEISTLDVYCNSPAANFIDLQQNNDEQPPLSDEKSKKVISVSDSAIIKEYDCKEEKLSEKISINKESEKIMESLPEHKPFKYVFPPIDLLRSNKKTDNKKEIAIRTEKLNQTFQAFGVNAGIINVTQGPRFTRFEIQIGTGVRIRDILKIENDIKLNLEATNLHIEAPIPGKTTIGIDAENEKPSIVTFREMIESEDFREFPSNLAVAIGKDGTGNIIIESIDTMCHLLIGGTTGSGKSVCINSIVMSILYKAAPNEVKLILIDTKAINLSIYNGIPYLLFPVVTNLQKTIDALQWCITEMMDRYKKFSAFNTRELSEYNKSIEKRSATDKSLQKLPSIVVIIDDLSDLMIWDNHTIEECICRLAQMGRACGIHLIISTQRPSTDVITGIIKANIPSRISFNVFSAIDSRTILDAKGAEELSTDGDMLFYPQGKRTPLRVQGTFVTDTEITDVIDFIKNHTPTCPKYYNAENYLQSQTQYMDNTLDYYFEEAGKFVIEKEKASIGMLQRIFKIGFNRAARIMDQLEDSGVVGMEEGTKPKKVLMNMKEFEQYIENLSLNKRQ